MTRNGIRGPLASLAAVAALGGGLFALNDAQAGDAAPTRAPVAQVTSIATPPPAAPRPAAQPPVEFPASARFAGRIPTKSGVITLDIKVTGERASAYACDGAALEAWLSGSARRGALSLASKDGASRLVGRLQDESVVGTVWIGGQQRAFIAAPNDGGSGSGVA